MGKARAETVWDAKDPLTATTIFLARLRKAGFECDRADIRGPSPRDTAAARKLRGKFLVARLDGVQHQRLSGPNVHGFVAQRRPALLPAAQALAWVPGLPPALSALFNRYLNRHGAWVLRHADALIFESELSRDMHRAYLGYRPGGRPETVILNGVDLDEFRPRRGARLEGEPAAIVSAAVHRLRKRPQEAVRLVNRLAGDYPRIRLHVLGAFDPLVEEALSALDTSRCTFHGRVHPDKLAPFYAGADVLLALGVFDACPNAVSEGLASGLPVLTPAESGAAELIGTANRDWAVPEGVELETHQSHYVAAAIPRLPLDPYADAFRAIMDDPVEASRRARARAEAALDIREVAARYTAFIEAALAGRDAGVGPRAGVAPP